jgi:uncharacterized protein YndB with AHSA1/START domain
MTEKSTVHNTFVIERIYAHPPARVFAAFSDPARKRRWFAEGSHHDVEEFSLDFRVGGRERIQSRFRADTPFPGVALISDGIFQNIEVNRRIVTASTMTLGDRCISASLVTIELLPSKEGAVLICTHQGAFFEGADGPQRREAGWRELLDRLNGELSL